MVLLKWMDMKKMPLAIIGLVLIILVAGVILLSTTSTNQSSNQPANPAVPYSSDAYTYYWSPTCPHCLKVNEFTSTWSGKDKIKINKKDVSSNRDYASDLVQKGSSVCKLPQEQIGTVPLLITPDGKCFNGDQPIIDYYKSLNL